MSIYLDNASIVKPRQEIIDAVVNALQNNWYNASAVNYDEGLDSRRIMQKTKSLIAKEINCGVNEIILCGSGSEANTLAIDGWLSANYRTRFVTGVLEHDSILMNPKASQIITCDNLGFYDMKKIKKIRNQLVSLQLANNEIGTIQNIKEISKILHENNCVIHTDATQAFGHIHIDIKDLDVDMLSSSSQKISGVCGSGFLYVKDGVQINSIIYGTQENGKRGGTYNIPAISAFGKSIELINYTNSQHIETLRNYLYSQLVDIGGIHLNGDFITRLPNNLNIRIDNLDINSQQFVSVLGQFGYLCSAGSACSAGNNKPSHVLKALGLSDYEANSSIRISLSEDTTYKEIDSFVKDFDILLAQLRKGID